MKDRDFLFGVTADMVYEIDRTAANNGGSRKLTAEEAIKLCEVDAAQAVKRLRDDAARPQLVKRVEWRGFAHWEWWVETERAGDEQYGEVVTGPSQAFTERGAWKKAHRAYVAALTALTPRGEGSAAYAAEPMCQCGIPFTRGCKTCKRADS